MFDIKIYPWQRYIRLTSLPISRCSHNERYSYARNYDKRDKFDFGIVSVPFLLATNRIGGVIVTVLASTMVDRGIEPLSGQTRLKLVIVASPQNTLN